MSKLRFKLRGRYFTDKDSLFSNDIYDLFGDEIAGVKLLDIKDDFRFKSYVESLVEEEFLKFTLTTKLILKMFKIDLNILTSETYNYFCTDYRYFDEKNRLFPLKDIFSKVTEKIYPKMFEIRDDNIKIHSNAISLVTRKCVSDTLHKVDIISLDIIERNPLFKIQYYLEYISSKCDIVVDLSHPKLGYVKLVCQNGPERLDISLLDRSDNLHFKIYSKGFETAYYDLDENKLFMQDFKVGIDPVNVKLTSSDIREILKDVCSSAISKIEEHKYKELELFNSFEDIS